MDKSDYSYFLILKNVENFNKLFLSRLLEVQNKYINTIINLIIV